MKPSERARVAAAITLSKGKMYEYGVPVEHHLALPSDLDLEQQFPLAIGTLGDFASEAIAQAIELPLPRSMTPREEVIFAAQVLQAFDDSLLNQDLSYELRLLAGAAFYLGDVPGGAAVLMKRLALLQQPTHDPLAVALRVALDRPWVGAGIPTLDPRVAATLAVLRQHFQSGRSDGAQTVIRDLREWAYKAGSAHELLLADLLGAVSIARIANSGWTLLPAFSGLPTEAWQDYLSRPTAIREMWPSQRMLGQAGLFRGASGIVQMPTSAGKSRAIELILRAAFLSGRTSLAVVVAPFRALCQEIANDLGSAFVEDGYRVNQLSDALQPDFKDELFDVFDIVVDKVPHVVVLTPEKLLYVLRQEPRLVGELGLIVYDEGHQFDTGTRGVTYELLLTSIKRLLPASAQTVLISAVIQNAAAVAKWLLSDEGRVVSDRWLQTRRLVAFASLPTGKTGQLQFNPLGEGTQQFFVPRVIVQETLKNFPLERAKRVFPTSDSGSVALHLGLRLASNGGVAIYTRTKASAAKIVRDSVTEVFARGVSLPAPAESSDAGELQRFKNLFTENFGEESYLTKGAALGLFAHHGNTPHGLRLAIEHAMRKDYIRLIVCTSTLAQGVNLPIRYLLVTTPMQGREAIRARDFHNLMGRAGRAGMYGEGTVVFTDHRLYDERIQVPRRWNSALELLRPESAGPTGSTLLQLLEPMRSDSGVRIINNPAPVQIATLLVDDRQEIYRRIENLSGRLVKAGFSTDGLRRQLNIKKETIEAIESFLMTYRGDRDSETFLATSRTLARETLAYSLATPEQRNLLEDVFERVARRIDSIVPNTDTQARYGRTLLGVDAALTVDRWVSENLVSLVDVDSADMLFEEVWPLLTQLSAERRFKDTAPQDALQDLARGWLAGKPFKELLANLDAVDAGYPFRNGKQGFSIDSVVELCEQAFGFEFALVLSATRSAFEAMFSTEAAVQFAACADLLQKRLKYGLPSQDAISYFEAGFSERVVAQKVADEIFWEVASSSSEATAFVRRYADEVRALIETFPSYFEFVLERIAA
jgi:POLQ-like helicase